MLTNHNEPILYDVFEVLESGGLGRMVTPEPVTYEKGRTICRYLSSVNNIDYVVTNEIDLNQWEPKYVSNN